MISNSFFRLTAKISGSDLWIESTGSSFLRNGFLWRTVTRLRMGHKELNCTEESSKGSIKMNSRSLYREWEYSLWFSFYQADDIREESFLRQYSPSRPLDIDHGSSVDIRPHHSYDHRIESIKKEPESRISRPHMLQKQESSIPFTNPSKFSEPFHGVLNRTEDKCSKDRVKDLVRECQPLGIHFL